MEHNILENGSLYTSVIQLHNWFFMIFPVGKKTKRFAIVVIESLLNSTEDNIL